MEYHFYKVGRLNRSAACISLAVATLLVAGRSTSDQSRQLYLDALVKASVGQHPLEWEKAVRKLRPRHMPPGITAAR
jgi:hypothetical protein